MKQHIPLSNIDLNVVLDGLKLLGISREHTAYTCKWASDLYIELQGYVKPNMSDILPK